MLSITAIKGRLESARCQALRREGFIATFLLFETSLAGSASDFADKGWSDPKKHTEAPGFDGQALIRQSRNARTP
jgi:hypothetical protein